MLICLVIKAFLKKKEKNKALLRLPTFFCSCRADAEFDVFFGWLVDFLQCFRWDLGLFACYTLFVPLNDSTSLQFPEWPFALFSFWFWNLMKETHFVAQRLWWFLCVCVHPPTPTHIHTMGHMWRRSEIYSHHMGPWHWIHWVRQCLTSLPRALIVCYCIYSHCCA